MKNKNLQEIIGFYNRVVGGIDAKAKANKDGRAYGGVVRMGKGKMVEDITKLLVLLAWKKLKQNPSRLSLSSKTITIPINKSYLKRIDAKVKRKIERNIKNYKYRYKPDVFVSVDGKPVLEIECKAYTENAMLKRILVDATLVKSQHPKASFALLQLESQLGGDYSGDKQKKIGSSATITLLSYFDVNLTIITLLAGERKVNAPIHEKRFFKPLTEKSLERAVSTFAEILKKYA